MPTSPPAVGVKEYLVRQGAEVRCLFHPLGPEEEGRHVVERWLGGTARRRTMRLPSHPPLTYPFDLLIPFDRRPVNVWIGFDNLSTARGLARRRRGLVDVVVHWSVDFVPDRFGPGSAMTRAYDALDAFCCRRADVRVEVSELALAARRERYELAADDAPTLVVPIGLWADETRKVPKHAFDRPRLVFVGHLVERMGVDTAIRAVAALKARGKGLGFDVVGRGPEHEALERLAVELLVEDLVVFHGFQVANQLERLLTGASIAVAPYRDDGQSFTRFADPSKLKAYLAAGLPIVLTDVPPNASQLAAAGATIVANDDPASIAAAIEALVVDRDRWEAMRTASLAEARRYDWAALVAPVLAELGFVAAS